MYNMTPNTQQIVDSRLNELSPSEGLYASKKDSKKNGYLSIGEVIRKTNVTKATVHHYVALKVLPTPIKTAHNMAYYHPTTVSIINTVRALRDRHVPLSVAKQMLDEYGLDKVKEMLQKTSDESVLIASTLSGTGVEKPRSEILSEYNLTEKDLAELENLGLLKFSSKSNLLNSSDKIYDSISVELISSLSKMREAGLNESLGFSPCDVVLYQEALENLVKSEVVYFSKRLLSIHPKDEAQTVMKAALEQAENICVLVRIRILLNLVDANFKDKSESKKSFKKS